MTERSKESAEERMRRMLGSRMALTSKMPLKRLRLNNILARKNMRTEPDTMEASLLSSMYVEVRLYTKFEMESHPLEPESELLPMSSPHTLCKKVKKRHC